MRLITLLIALIIFPPIMGNAADTAQRIEKQPSVSVQPVGRDAGGLNFDSVEGSPSEVQAVQKQAPTMAPAALALVVLLLATIAAASVWGSKTHRTEPWLSLASLPGAMKLVCTFTLLIFSATYILAALTVYLDTRIVYSSVEEYFQFLKPARLTALSHAHLMSIATMNFITGTFFALSRSTSGYATGIVTAAFSGIVGDIGAWWLIKYFGGGYEILSTVTGILFSGAFAIMTVMIFYDMWLGQIVPASGWKGK